MAKYPGPCFVGCQDGAYAPDENAGVPQVFPGIEKLARRFQVGFFRKTQHFADVGDHLFAKLDVPIAGIGAGRLDAQGHQGVVPGGKIQGLADFFQKAVFLQHDVVGGRDNKVGFRVQGGQLESRVGHAGAGVVAAGFADDLIVGQFRYLRPDQVAVSGIGDHENVFRRTNGQKPLEGEPQQALAHAEHIEELFGTGFAAARPETAADATGHDGYVRVRVQNDE